MAGILLYPSGEGPWPGVITLQGSGATERDNFGYFPAIWNIFLDSGIAVLAYDKPGVGESSGDWRDQTLTERADEAISAIHFMKKDPDVSGTCVGLFGHSQGGWVAPIAATRAHDDVSFVIVQSGPGIRSQDQCIHDVEHSMRADGYPEEVIQGGVEFVRLLIDAGERNVQFDELSRDLLEQHRQKPWWDYFTIDEEKMWTFFRRSWRTDPHPGEVWRHVSCPVLALFGENDLLLPVQQSVEIYQKALDASGNPDVTINIIDDANHQFLVEDPDTFIAGYQEAIRTWVERPDGVLT